MRRIFPKDFFGNTSLKPGRSADRIRRRGGQIRSHSLHNRKSEDLANVMSNAQQLMNMNN